MSEIAKERKNRREYFAIYRKLKGDQIRKYHSRYYSKNQEKIRMKRRDRYQREKVKRMVE